MALESFHIRVTDEGGAEKVANEIRGIGKAGKKTQADVKKFSGEAAKSHETLRTRVESATNSIRESWVKISGAIAAVSGSVALVAKSWQTFQEETALAAASSGANIERIQNATQGLITGTESMRLAAAGLNAEFVLTQEEIEKVSRFLLVLRDRGITDTQRAAERLGEAIRESNVNAFEEWGFIIDETSGTLEAHNAIMKTITEQNALFTDSMLALQGDEVQRGLVQLSDFWSDLQVNIGRATIATLRYLGLVQGLGGGRSALEELDDFGGFGDFVGGIVAGATGAQAGRARGFGLADAGKTLEQLLAQQRALNQLVLGDLSRISFDVLGSLNPEQQSRIEKLTEELEKTAKSLREGRGRRAEPTDFERRLDFILGGGLGDPAGLVSPALIPEPDPEASEGIGALAGALTGGVGLGGGLGGLSAIEENQRLREQQAGIDRLAELERARGLALESSAAFQTLESAAVRAFTAMASGAIGAGEAMKQFAGDALTGEGQLLIGKGISALMQAGIFAWLPGAQVNASGLAASGAASLAAGGILTAAGRLLGGGGPTPLSGRDPSGGRGGGSGGSGNRRRGPGAGEGLRTERIIIINDDFGRADPREQNERIRRAMSGTESDVRFA